MTLLSPQSTSPKGHWGQHLVTVSVVYSGIHFRRVSDISVCTNCSLKATKQEAH